MAGDLLDFPPQAGGGGGDFPPGSPPPPPSAPKKAGAKKAAAKKPDTPPRPVGRPSNNAVLTAKVTELYGALGLGLLAVKPDLGIRVMSEAAPLAESAVQLGNEYPAVKAMLERLTSVSAIGAFLAVHLRVFGPALLDAVGMGDLAGFLGGGAPTPGAPPDAPKAGAQV